MYNCNVYTNTTSLLFFSDVTLRKLLSYITLKRVMNISIMAEKCDSQSHYSCYSSYTTIAFVYVNEAFISFSSHPPPSVPPFGSLISVNDITRSDHKVS